MRKVDKRRIAREKQRCGKEHRLERMQGTKDDRVKSRRIKSKEGVQILKTKGTKKWKR